MENVTNSSVQNQARNETSEKLLEFQDLEPEAFFENLEKQTRMFARNVIIRWIQEEFDHFIGAGPYQRTDQRSDQRNGFRTRHVETRLGVLEDIPIPRARNGNFNPTIFHRWKRRERKVTRLLASLFIHGISTRKVKCISKLLWDKSYSSATVSRSNHILQEEYLQWMHRPITEPIRYLILDAVNLKIRRHWVSKEALLCAIGITDKGTKEFLCFHLGGRESTHSWETLIEKLISRGISKKHLQLITVDGNPGLLRALETLFPGIPIQRCVVHKIWNVVGKCPRNLRNIVPAEMKSIFYATNHEEALDRFKTFKERWQQQLPGLVGCIEKDLDSLFHFYAFPYRHWILIRSTNVIERAFKEFRRRVKIMETFPNEMSCHRIMFSLAKLMNENWKYKPIKNF
jgi:transposase-like protein